MRGSFTLEEAEKVWLIGDTHFDHVNIIQYCNRPFRCVKVMNGVLLRNWNDTIAPDDLVYFLGDMAFGRGSRSPKWWATQLTGRKIWVKGSHDRGIYPLVVMPGVERVVFRDVINCGGVEFLLVHNLFVNDWRGWVIHGHAHDTRSHIDVQWKRVNVSVEVTDYKPISLAQVMREIG